MGIWRLKTQFREGVYTPHHYQPEVVTELSASTDSASVPGPSDGGPIKLTRVRGHLEGFGNVMSQKLKGEERAVGHQELSDGTTCLW